MKLSDSEISNRLKQKFADLPLEWVEPENGDRYLFVSNDKNDQVLQHLRDDAELSFDYLMSVSAFDAKEHIEVTYHLYSYKYRHTFVVKVKVPRENGKLKTAYNLWGAADFQEREVFDHFGITFEGHPNMKRILLPDDWVGYPLRKDYVEQEEYNGMATTRPSLL
jgi:NADH-quinone oxidoreductase subunit C